MTSHVDKLLHYTTIASTTGVSKVPDSTAMLTALAVSGASHLSWSAVYDLSTLLTTLGLLVLSSNSFLAINKSRSVMLVYTDC
jgi:hypothetical protein